MRKAKAVEAVEMEYDTDRIGHVPRSIKKSGEQKEIDLMNGYFSAPAAPQQ